MTVDLPPLIDDTCIVGAGPAGLAIARALSERGLPYTHLERHTEVGGLWDIDNPGSPMYESAHFISSKTLSAFSGYPMPEDYPDYPSHKQVKVYARNFADAYGLTERIEFGTEVTKVERVKDGTWIVTRAGGVRTRHSTLAVCSGSQWFDNSPEIPGTFSGEILHSLRYSSADYLRGKRVLVVGGGNSGADIACDAGRNAESASISLRRGYWFIPKHIFGQPVDVFAEGGPSMPMWLEQKVFGGILRLMNGNPERLGLEKPDHKLFETHPVSNTMLLYALQHGDVVARRGIRTTEGRTVTYTDGTSEEIDLIILATGYIHRIPIAQQYFGNEQHPDLYLSAFSREYSGLFGLFVETNSAAWPLFDTQAQMIASYLEDRIKIPARAERFSAKIRTDDPDLSGGVTFDASSRHHGYVDSVALKKYLRKVVSSMGWNAIGAPPPASTAKSNALLETAVR